jgi:hypothetical protein
VPITVKKVNISLGESTYDAVTVTLQFHSEAMIRESLPGLRYYYKAVAEIELQQTPQEG